MITENVTSGHEGVVVARGANRPLALACTAEIHLLRGKRILPQLRDSNALANRRVVLVRLPDMPDKSGWRFEAVNPNITKLASQMVGRTYGHFG